MAKVVKLLSMTVEAPLMIDSTESDVVARALEHVPGRAIVNSVNLEGGRARIDTLLPIVKKHGAALVVLTIDERWTRTGAPGGFRPSLASLLDSGRVRLLRRSRFRHRVSTGGNPIQYELIVAVLR